MLAAYTIINAQLYSMHIIKPMQTHIDRKKYVHNSVNLEGRLNKIENQIRHLFRPLVIHSQYVT
jgi:hypothetical protein